MSKTLQASKGTDERITSAVWSTEIILDQGYCNRAISIIKSAKSELRLCAYAWRWYANEPEIGIQKLNLELLRAVKRGVIVHCLVDTDDLRDRFRYLGFDARSVHPRRTLHTKAICADYLSLLIGSHNLTKRATLDNYEASIFTNEFEVCAQFCDYFDKLWHSRG